MKCIYIKCWWGDTQWSFYECQVLSARGVQKVTMRCTNYAHPMYELYPTPIDIPFNSKPKSCEILDRKDFIEHLDTAIEEHYQE